MSLPWPGHWHPFQGRFNCSSQHVSDPCHSLSSAACSQPSSHCCQHKSSFATHRWLHILFSTAARIWRERHWDAEPGSGRIGHSLGLDLHAKPALVEIWIMLPVHIARFPLWVYMYIIQVCCLKMESFLCPAGEIPPQHVLLLVPTGISFPALVGPGLWSGFLSGFNWSLGISRCTG